MREFFTGWRRKAGCVALVMACAMTGMWIRSLGTADFLTWGGEASHIEAGSFRGKMEFSREAILIRTYGLEGYPMKSGFESLNLRRADGTVGDVSGKWEFFILNGECDRKLEVFDQGLAAGTYNAGESKIKMTVALVSYWTVTVPLALLSAYLILWKPRKAK